MNLIDIAIVAPFIFSAYHFGKSRGISETTKVTRAIFGHHAAEPDAAADDQPEPINWGPHEAFMGEWAKGVHLSAPVKSSCQHAWGKCPSEMDFGGTYRHCKTCGRLEGFYADTGWVGLMTIPKESPFYEL